MNDSAPASMSTLQELAFGEASDYDRGSPHLLHTHLRAEIIDKLRVAVLDRLDATGSCTVLEIGAGHGTFTDHLLAAGARVIVTEMSRPALSLLHARLHHNRNLELVYDADGSAALSVGRIDIVACVSVLHHIPDYLGFLEGLVTQLSNGGALLSFQDPLHYSRRLWTHRIDRLAFLTWRLRQGNLGRGLATQLRRFRGVYDDSRAEDTVEYHVVRQGLDEQAVVEALEPRFATTTLTRYWSTPGRWSQRLGERLGIENTFSFHASGKR